MTPAPTRKLELRDARWWECLLPWVNPLYMRYRIEQADEIRDYWHRQWRSEHEAHMATVRARIEDNAHTQKLEKAIAQKDAER